MNLITQRSFTAFLLVATLMTACTETKTKNSQEEIEIKQMDSTAKAVKEQTKDLEDQTKKVEESLEKLDKEFDNQN